MTRTSSLLVGALVACMAAPGADTAGVSGNPYEGIATRNVFHLNPPPLPPDPEASKPPPPKIFLTGITTLGGRRALLKTTPSAKPGEPPKEKSYLLSEGERQDDLEVLVIDEKAGAVRVKCAGTEATVTFKDNAVATAAAPASAAPPAAAPPGVQGANPALPGGNPGAPGQPHPGLNPALQAQMPLRPVRAAAPVVPPLDAAANFGGHEPGHGYDEHGL